LGGCGGFVGGGGVGGVGGVWEGVWGWLGGGGGCVVWGGRTLPKKECEEEDSRDAEKRLNEPTHKSKRTLKSQRGVARGRNAGTAKGLRLQKKRAKQKATLEKGEGLKLGAKKTQKRVDQKPKKGKRGAKRSCHLRFVKTKNSAERLDLNGTVQMEETERLTSHQSTKKGGASVRGNLSGLLNP